MFSWLNGFSAWLTGAGPDDGSISILAPFLMLNAGIAGLIIALGFGAKRRAAGAWIDTRNRVSLARAQVIIWTAVALSGYAALAMFNAGFAAAFGFDKLASFSVFPQIPASIAAALGIAGLSPMLSSLILPTKDKPEVELRDPVSDVRKRGAAFFGADTSGLDKRETPMEASIADIFMGEENANKDTVDVSRLQNVVITVTLALGFFSVLAGMMSAIDAQALLGAKGPVFISLPAMGATFTSLLGISHATYLVSKAADKGVLAAKDSNG